MSTNPMSLKDLVTDRVSERTGRRIRNLVVEVAPGGAGVVLRGRTASFYVKQLAQQGAREALPLARLENAIVVD